MDSEICTSCRQPIPSAEQLVVYNGRVVCSRCALKESTPAPKSKGVPPRPVATASAPRRPADPWAVNRRRRSAPDHAASYIWLVAYAAIIGASIYGIDLAHKAESTFRKHWPVWMAACKLTTPTATVGRCTVSIVDCLAEPSIDVGPHGHSIVTVIIRIQNHSTRHAVRYLSWRRRGATMATIVDASWGSYAHPTWQTQGIMLIGNAGFHGETKFLRAIPAAADYHNGFRWPLATIQPGGAIYDLLQFPTADGIIRPRAILKLSAANLGGHGIIRFVVTNQISPNYSVDVAAQINQFASNWPGVRRAPTSPLNGSPQHPLVDRVQISGLNAGGPPPWNSATAASVSPRPANPNGLFNHSAGNGMLPTPALPRAFVTLWQLRADPPSKPLRIDPLAHVVLPLGLHTIAACPQGHFLAAHQSFRGRYLHFYTINLRDGATELAVSTPLLTNIYAVLSPDGHCIAAIGTSAAVAANGPNLPSAQKVVMALWSCGTGRMRWHQSFAGICPYQLIGFASGDRLIICSKTAGGEMFYRLAAKSGRIMNSWFAKKIQWRPHAPISISPGGKYLAVFNRQSLYLWNDQTGKLRGKSQIMLSNSEQDDPVRVAFSPHGSQIAVEISGAAFGRFRYHLFTFSAMDGKVIAHGVYQPERDGFENPAAHRCFGAISGNRGWQVGLDMVAKTGHAYHRFANPGRGGPTDAETNLWAWMPDQTHMICAASEYNQWGYIVLHTTQATLVHALSAVEKGERSQDWKLGKMQLADMGRCVTLPFPTVLPHHWPMKEIEPVDHSTAVPGRIIATRLLWGSQGGPGRALAIDCVRFAGVPSQIALIAYRQTSTGADAHPTALWIDRVNLRSGDILGSFRSPIAAAHLLDLGPHGHRMLLSTPDTIDIYRWPKRGAPVKLTAWRLSATSPVINPDAITSGRLLPRDQLLTVSAQGNMIIWSIKGCRAECQMAVDTGIKPALDASRELVAFGAGQGLDVLNLKSDELIGPLAGFRRLLGPLSFSPNGRMLALSGPGAQIELWNVARGKCLGTFQPSLKPTAPMRTIPFGAWRGRTLQWFGNNYLQTNGLLFDLQKDRYVYRLETPYAYFRFSLMKQSFGRRCWTIQARGERWYLTGFQMPSEEMLAAISKQSAAKMLVKPGDDITVILKHGGFCGVGSKFLARARLQLQKEGFHTVPGKSLIMTISSTREAPRQQTYGFGIFANQKPFTLSEQGRLVSWTVARNHKVIWIRRFYVPPLFPLLLSSQANTNPQAYVDHYNKSRFRQYAWRPDMPDHIFAAHKTPLPVADILMQGVVSQNRGRFVSVPLLQH